MILFICTIFAYWFRR